MPDFTSPIYIPPIESLLASANPATPATARRMKIYFQPSPNDPNILGPNENDPPVSPAIDSNIDIAISNKKQYIRYAVDRSTNATAATANNPTPLSSEVGNTAQKTYINQVPNLNYSGIPNAFNVFSNNPTMFENQTLTRDAGVAQVDIINTEVGAIKGFYAGNVGRPFAIRKYVGQLNALETSDPDDPAQKNAHHNRLVDAQLLKFRGFNSQEEHKHVPPAGGDIKTKDNPITLGSMFYQGGLGKFHKGTYVRSNTTTTATALTIEQLKQVGLNIVFNAVGGDILNGESSIKTPGDAALAELALVTPIGPRIGQKVKLSRFSAASEAEKLFGAKKINSTTFIDTDDSVDSYGSFNNPLSQFDALVSIGQIAVSMAMILTFVTFLGSISALVNAFSSDRTSLAFATSGRPTRLVKGSSTLYASPSEENKVYPSQVPSNVGDFLIQMMNLGNIFSKPKHQFEDCLAAGMEEFFGLTPNSGGLMRIMTESGRLNVILRELIRNGVDLGESAAAVFTGTGAASPIAGVLGFFKSLTELKIIKFINVLVAIGDKALEGRGRNRNLFSRTNIGGVDSLPDIGYNIQKSRLSDGTLAWSTTTAPYYSLGLASIGATSKLQSELNLEIKPIPNFLNATPASGSGRLTDAKVKEIENSLESDYMPFYFHDLRTNEIMSFHAFLENASEDFAVEYTSQEGYGRMDKVQIYKGTTRNITVDFKMIATNKISHDDMWYKINRLAMMIYPQWTQGRKLDVGNLRFIQPFSQIPGATPVIRLRLGDLYKSNYSKMAVARLFGATTRPNYNVDSSVVPAAETPIRPDPANDPRYVKFDQIVTQNGDFTSGQDTPRNGTNVAQFNPINIFTSDISRVVLDLSNPSTRLALNKVEAANSSQIDRLVTALNTAGNGIKMLCIFNGTTVGGGSVRLTAEKITFFETITSDGHTDMVDVEILMRNTEDMTIDTSSIKSMMELQVTRRLLLDEVTRTPSPEEPAPVDPNVMRPRDFYDDTKNPILKAFNSTAGKGLAGVITSFKIDYKESDKRWGTDASTTLRAPMYVTISVTMAVIHDIPLGLDSNGIMNAPIWPVGDSSNYFMRGTPPVARLARSQAVDSEVAGAARGLR